MADQPDKQALQAAVLEDIRKALYEPRTTLAQAKRKVALILMRLRIALGEKSNRKSSARARKPRCSTARERPAGGGDGSEQRRRCPAQIHPHVARSFRGRHFW
jgi:hypothetical protein